MEIDSDELRKIMYRLFLNDEDECVEFKEAKNTFDFDELGQYFLLWVMKQHWNVDTGIKRVFNMQRNRYFPMLDYELSEERRVKVTLYGKVIDANYSRLSTNNPSISFDEIVLLDRIQKKLPISKEEYRILKKKELVEGRYPNINISAAGASAIDKKAEYTNAKGF